MKECVQVQCNQLCNICTCSKYVYITYYKSTKTKWKTKQNIKYIFTQYHSRHATQNIRVYYIKPRQVSFGQSIHIIKTQLSYFLFTQVITSEKLSNRRRAPNRKVHNNCLGPHESYNLFIKWEGNHEHSCLIIDKVLEQSKENCMLEMNSIVAEIFKSKIFYL